MLHRGLLSAAALIGLTLAAPDALAARSRHADTWTFGYRCRLAWNADATAVSFTTDPSIYTGEGCASFADPESGALRIYSDGMTVWNGNGTQISTGLGGNDSSLHSAVIVPAAGEPGKVYVFGHGCCVTSEVKYQKFDLTGAAATTAGSIGTVNLGASAAREGMLVLQHANGIDSWVLVSGGTQIFTIAVTAGGGVQLANTINSGLSIWSNGWSIFSANHQNDKIVMSGNNGGDIVAWDFDPATGTLSNRTKLNTNFTNSEFYGGVFSPDGTKFYFSVLTAASGAGQFYQYDFGNGVFTLLSTKPTRYTHGDGRLGPDGKIYVAGANSGGVHVISNPNAAGTACGFVYNALTQPSGCSVALGLPQIPSPLNAINLNLSVTPTSPTLVTTTATTVSGNANAPNGSTVTVTVTGPNGFSDTCTATVTSALWSCAAGAIGPFTLGGAYTVAATVTYNAQTAQGSGAFDVVLCGDGLRAPSEPCDDDDLDAGDGCSPLCTIEDGWSCDNASPSLCAPMPPAQLGCADGSREGYTATSTYTTIASCGGAWDVPGAFHSAPACGRAAGNTGANQPGEGCNVEDICASGWHVCHGPDDIAQRTHGSGCSDAVSATYPGAAFFMTRTSGSGTGNCDEVINGYPQSFNDIFGCGTMGYPPQANCYSLNESISTALA